MYNSQKHSVPDCIPHRDTESDFSEWFEVESTYADCIGNTNTLSANLGTASNHSGSFFEEMYSRSKNVDKEKKDADQRYNNLIVENENLNYKLSNEKQKCEKLEKKLQYIQENQDTINRIKQTYLSAKYSQSIGRPMVDVKEEACQTWHGIICPSCIETAEMRRVIDKVQAEKSNDFPMVVVKRSELAKLYDTVSALQDMIEKREKSWSLNAEREEMYKGTISELKNKMKLLEILITKSHEKLQSFNMKADFTLDKAEKENVFLRKIIVKMEKRQRALEKTYNIKKHPFTLTGVEKEMVQELIRKYSAKVKEKFLENMIQENATQLSNLSGKESSRGDFNEELSSIL